ncbi:hypothetical protein AZKH_4445 [Azoarcus sp. KH32C]|nr:hypothetical protein AZKH_4445 [Azoarcus sp. KH32C]
MLRMTPVAPARAIRAAAPEAGKDVRLVHAVPAKCRVEATLFSRAAHRGSHPRDGVS